MTILSELQGPADLRGLDEVQLAELSAEVEMPEDKVTEALRFAAEPLPDDDTLCANVPVATPLPSFADAAPAVPPEDPCLEPVFALVEDGPDAAVDVCA